MKNIILVFTVIMMGILFTGCTTTNIPFTVREPEKWNEQRAFDVINTLSRSVNESMAIGSNNKLRQEPKINENGLLMLKINSSVQNYADKTRISYYITKAVRIPVQEIQQVTLQRKRSHWYASWLLFPLVFAPVVDTFQVEICFKGESPTIYHEPPLGDDGYWFFFPCWLVNPVHFVNNPKQQKKVREIAEAFEWLRVNSKSIPLPSTSYLSPSYQHPPTSINSSDNNHVLIPNTNTGFEDVQQKLKDLDELKESGILSEEEYQTKRKAALDQL